MSWIHINDLVKQFIFLIENDGKSSHYNGTAPHPVSNLELTQTLGATLGKPAIFPVPGLFLKFIFGEMSDILLKGQRVFPRQFLAEGFQFQFLTLHDALEDLLSVSNRFHSDNKGFVGYGTWSKTFVIYHCWYFHNAFDTAQLFHACNTGNLCQIKQKLLFLISPKMFLNLA